MIESLIDRKWYSFQTLTEAFGLGERTGEDPDLVSIVGAGGKTTILRTIQREWMGKRLLHAISTTTHMEQVNDGSFLEEESSESFFSVYEREHTVLVGKKEKEGKITGASDSFLYRLRKEGAALLIEADGARHRSVKFPQDREPVILPESTTVICVYGMDALQKPICEVGFREELLCSFLGKKPSDSVKPQDICKLAVSELAGRKDVPKEARYQVVFSKCDLLSTEDYIRMKEVAQQIQKECQSPVHLLGNLTKK